MEELIVIIFVRNIRLIMYSSNKRGGFSNIKIWPCLLRLYKIGRFICKNINRALLLTAAPFSCNNFLLDLSNIHILYYSTYITRFLLYAVLLYLWWSRVGVKDIRTIIALCTGSNENLNSIVIYVSYYQKKCQ